MNRPESRKAPSIAESHASRPNLSNHLVQEIVKLIQAKELKPGDRLPAVRILAQTYSVATPTVREALGRLQANGVVEIRHGSGVYVRSDQARIVIANPVHGAIDSRTILDLLEARRLIEPRLAELTARDASVEDIAKLERRLDEAGRHIGGDSERLHRANMSFHRDIAYLSGNLVLSQTIESLIELYSSENLVILELYEDYPRDHQEHVEILEAIKSKDSPQARELMHQHLWSTKAIVEARLAG